MSYERRLELEAMPAENGWGKWVGVIGHGTSLVERKNLTPTTIWITGANGPREIEVYQYENYLFVKDGKTVDERSYSYTKWHTDREYTNYSPRARRLDLMCAETREELCLKVQVLLESELFVLRKSVTDREATLSKYK